VTYSMLALMAPADGAGAGLTMLLLQIGAIAAVFYFFILRPQSQARKKHQQLLLNLKKGDEVTTVGGLIGKVKDIKDDRVTIESGTASVVVDRTRIMKVGDQAAPGGVLG
jgi:preprotein translocase subunit YajC